MSFRTVFAVENGEYHYEETLADREAAGSKRVPPACHERKPECPDDPAQGRHGRSAAARRRASAARGGMGADEPGDGRGGAPCRGRAEPAACGAASAPVGQRGWLLCDRRTEGADPENPIANQR